jgi:Ser/Thr protein kinase RdoA (MazF antagonist)
MGLEAARTAVELWKIDATDIALAAHRENEVYRVSSASGSVYALRLHRPGYRDASELTSELAMMDALSAAGVHVPQPIRSQRGELIEKSASQYVSLLSWVGGAPLMAASAAMSRDEKLTIFRELGRAAARMHTILDRWVPPIGFTRVRWDVDGLLGESPHWGRFWACDTLSEGEQRIVLEARSLLREHVAESQADFGLIHADLVGENVLVEDGRVCIIDFDDSGFGFRLQDLATALVKFVHDTDYDALWQPLIEGYGEVRELDTRLLDAFLAIRSLSSLGWSWPRRHDPGGQERHGRARALALRFAAAYVDGKT